MKPFWITFYSYKGGVGRSLALSNIAALLVKNGRKVVLIDFDLEAPGLDSFDEFSCIAGKKGVVEYTSEFCRTNRAPEIGHYIHHCHLHDAPSGELWIMPAGTKNASYNQARTSINWVEMYESGVGTAFVENWKAAIARHCQPDYVFVDSRTGLTDVGGICTLQLPDLVVMLFGLNEQNIKGIAAVAKTVRASDCGRIPQIHYVASPVPNMPAERKDLVAERLDAAKKDLGVEVESLIKYSSSAALHERLFTLEDNARLSPLVTDYQNLLEKLIVYNRTGIDLITKEVESAISSSDADKMQRLLKVVVTDFAERAEGCFLSSRLYLALHDRHAAVEAAKKAISIDPAHIKSLYWLIKHYQTECQHNKALALCDAALAAKSRLSGFEIQNIQSEMGNIAMMASKPDVAAHAFNLATETQQKGNLDSWALSLYFNLAEARRRATKELELDLWTKVLDLFEQGGETSNFPPPVRANCLQAIHIAFAVTGNLDRAKQTLLKARDTAKLLGSVDEVFSVKHYSHESVSMFLTENDEMLAALERGELWDGMKLHVPEHHKNIPTKE